MSDSTIDFVRPYASVAQRHKDGLDAIITSIGTGGPGTVTIDDLMDAVYDYLVSVYTDIGSDPEGVESIRAVIANAINGYLDNGGSSPYLRSLQTVPPSTLGNLFDRLFDATKASNMLKSNASRQQMTLAIGEANVEYWVNQISTSGSWTNYMTGDGAVDSAAIPFWTDAAMFGTQFDFYQNNADDSTAVSSVIISALAGSLVAGAGKVVFGWVPKNVGAANGPIITTDECECQDMQNMKMFSSDLTMIGRPVGNVGRRTVNTRYRMSPNGNSGRDWRDLEGEKQVCIRFDNGWSSGDGC